MSDRSTAQRNHSHNTWRHSLPQLAGLPLLPIGPGGDGKAPADPKTGANLKDWQTASFTPEEVAAACSKVTAVGVRPGPAAGGLIAFDIDGATAVALLTKNGCDPFTAPTWQVRRDTDADRLKVIWRLPEELRDHIPCSVAKLTTKTPSARGAKDGENVATYYGAGQVLVLGQHLSSGGNYFWPEGHGPADLAEITPDWWEMAARIAEEHPPTSKASSSSTGRGDWRRINPCPICGRDQHAICSKHRDGRSILCFHGSTFHPPELKPGQVITGSDGQQWAFTGSRTNGDIGEFSHFKIDEPASSSTANVDLVVDGFPDHGDNSQQQGQQRRSNDLELLTYSQLIRDALNAIRKRDRDREMACRAEIKGRFRCSDAQITKALIEELTRDEAGTSTAFTYGTVDLDRTAGMDWLVEGFIPANDQVLLYGEAGAGKTTAAIGLAFAVIDGTGFLDRASCAPQGSVLFIASDSGADPIRTALQEMGLLDHPARHDQSAPHRFFVWAHDAEQGFMAWDASLPGLIALQDFIRENRIQLVLIDSAKAVTSKADLNYCENGPVTALLTFAKESLCRYCSIVWLHHDGTAKGSAAGAKAWKEVPSAVHAIEKYVIEGSGDERNGGGSRGPSYTSDLMRVWTVKKCRLGTHREFKYEKDTATGRLVLIPGAAGAVVHDARAAIVEVLSQAWQNGCTSLSRQEIASELRQRWSYSGKTTDNNLSRMVSARHPEVCRLSTPRGHYKLAPRVVEVLRAAQLATPSLNTSLLEGKEQGQTPVPDCDLVISREVPSGTQGNSAEFPREKLGNSQPASAGKGSGLVPSHGTFTPRARAQHTPPPPQEHAHRLMEIRAAHPTAHANEIASLLAVAHIGGREVKGWLPWIDACLDEFSDDSSAA